MSGLPNVALTCCRKPKREQRSVGSQVQCFVRRGRTPRAQGYASPARLFSWDALSAFQPTA